MPSSCVHPEQGRNFQGRSATSHNHIGGHLLPYIFPCKKQETANLLYQLVFGMLPIMDLERKDAMQAHRIS